MTSWAAQHRQAGRGRRPCLVWLHGLLGSGDDWLPVLPYFAGGPQVTLDLPGHGASAPCCRRSRLPRYRRRSARPCASSALAIISR